ncbi:MAG: recombinase family protein, partial [Oscillospiraceae bacterium]
MQRVKTKTAPAPDAFEPCITYYRYSSHRQGEQSIEGQRAEAQRWATEHGYTIVHEYIDRAMTGTNDDREQFQQMLKDIEKRTVSVLVLWKVDRMGRNKEEIAFNKYRCKKNGVKVIYTAENIPDTPEGVILESVLEGMAEYYSVQLSQNIRRGQRVSASKAQSIGGNRPLGYRTGADKRFEIDPEGAAIVQQVFQRYVKGETQAEIVSSLNAQGLRTLKKKPFTHNSLRTMLKNEKYIGVYSYKDEVRIDGGVPTIVDAETFRKAQEMLKVNKRAPAHKWAKADYLLTEKLFCGKCGGMMTGYSGTARNGDKHAYYACYNQRKKACDKKAVRKAWIEDMVLGAAKDVVFNDEMIDFIAENTYQYYLAQNTDTSYTDSLESNLAQVEASLANLIKALEAGIFNDTTKKRMDELEEQKRQIQGGLAQSKLREGLHLTKEHIIYFLLQFREMDLEDVECQKRLIATFVNSVFLYDGGDVTITFNYSGDGRTITLKEVDGARVSAVRPLGVKLHQVKRIASLDWGAIFLLCSAGGEKRRSETPPKAANERQRN